MYMATSATEEEPLTPRRQGGPQLPSYGAPSKRSIILGLGTLFAAIVASIIFWPKEDQQQKMHDVVVEVDQQALDDDDDGETIQSPIMYRPVCEYWNQETHSLAFQLGTQTSMTQPSQQWAQLACLPVQVESEPVVAEKEEQQSQQRYGLFRRKRSNDADNNEAVVEDVKNPLILDHYQAPDAVLKVNFNLKVFGDRPPIYGFGGAFTEASALNFQRLSEPGKEAVLQLLFGKENGLGYTLGRVHMNSCDFSVKSYAFATKDGDFELDTFDMGVHHDVESGMVDFALRATSLVRKDWSVVATPPPPSDDPLNNNDTATTTPVLMEDEAQNDTAKADDDVRPDGNLLLFASPWSPPAWMKNPTEEDVEGAIHAEEMTFSTLPTCLRGGVGPKSPYAASWALYFSKYLTAYANLGLPFWAVTVQNEPEFPAPWEACAFTPKTETAFVANHLGPRLRKDHPDVKLLVFDHNKDHINTWTNVLLNKTLGARDYVDGIAYHWYAGGMDRLLDGALGVPNMHRLQDNLRKQGKSQQLVLQSEACHCPTTAYAGGDLRIAWDRAERYAHTILADLMAGSNGWVEWNLLLDTIGGPNHLGNLCESTLLAAPHRALDADKDTPVLPDFEKDLPFGNVNIGDGRTREELNAFGFPAKYLDVGVVVQPMFYYMGHISRYVRPGSYAVAGLVTNSGNKESRIFRPKGSVVAGGGINNLARNGIEITLWPCEGSTRQWFEWNFGQNKPIVVHGHDWLGRPTKSCVSRFVDPALLGLTLVDCTGPDAGIFNILPLPQNLEEEEDPRFTIVLLNHPVWPDYSCLAIQKLANNGGANGPLGGAQVVLGACEGESAKWTIDAEFGEASSSFFGEEVCMTTGWPYLQMGAFVTHDNNKTVILLNEAEDPANFALQNEDNLVMTGSIPPRSIQTYVLK